MTHQHPLRQYHVRMDIEALLKLRARGN